MKSLKIIKASIFFILIIAIFPNGFLYGQPDSLHIKKHPVILDQDTLFFISERIGIYSAEERSSGISAKLKKISADDTLEYDSITVVKQGNYLILYLAEEPIMSVTRADAIASGVNDSTLAQNYRNIIIHKLKDTREIYSEKSLIKNGIFNLIYLAILILFLWILSKAFPWIYSKIPLLESKKFRNIKLRNKDVILSSTITKIILILSKGLSFALSLFAIYFFITKSIEIWPYTRKLDIQPVIKSIVLLVFYTALFYAIIKSLNSLVKLSISRYDLWRGTRLKSLKIKTIEILPVGRIIDFLNVFTKVLRLALTAVAFYSYLTIIFSLFSFSETWAKTLLEYVMEPVRSVGESILNFLPNLFFIIVLVFVFYYLIKAVKFFFLEIDKGTLTFPRFHKDWALPTYKIVRFLILVLAAIVIFPYLPGSSSPFFQGISVFLGILFSLGSSSAIANMVSGIVITYMRPFKLGDRVKIADTTGDVIEKTLLVTRIRTTKNVDVTIPNAMVLGSHIINYSSSAEEKGLILHTTVTIGYDVPWRKVHSLLLSAADETHLVLKESKPFVLQVSLDDYYVSYELNVYTTNSHHMAAIYSELHSKIHDKFNEAGVEIMSPGYTAVRDGSEVTIPKDYLPKKGKSQHPGLFSTLFSNQPEKD